MDKDTNLNFRQWHCCKKKSKSSTLYDIRIGKDFLKSTHFAPKLMLTIDNWDFLKLTSICTVKETTIQGKNETHRRGQDMCKLEI